MYLKPVPQPLVLILIAVFLVFGYIAGENKDGRFDEKDLNQDGAVTFQDFSIALYLVDQIGNALGEEVTHKQNIIEDVYPPVPLPLELPTPSN